MSKWPFAGLVCTLAASILLCGLANGEDIVPPALIQGFSTPVKVLTFPTLGDHGEPIFPGRVEAGDSAFLAFRVEGQLKELNVRMGQRVAKDALLAELDPTDFQLNFDARQAEFDLAQLEAERASTLFAQQLVSEDQYDTAQTGLATRRARLEQAREQLSYCQLRAPFAGVIAFTYVMPSEVVQPPEPILDLHDMSTLEVHFSLPSQYQVLLEGESRAKFFVTFELMPGVPLEARYKEVGMQSDPDTNSYPITLLVDSSDDFPARPGMPVSVRLSHPELALHRWVLPREALFDVTDDQAHVWRIDPSTMTIQKVSIELNADGVPRTGLSPGDQVVAAGVDHLTSGQRVQPWVREEGL